MYLYNINCSNTMSDSVVVIFRITSSAGSAFGCASSSVDGGSAGGGAFSSLSTLGWFILQGR